MFGFALGERGFEIAANFLRSAAEKSFIAQALLFGIDIFRQPVNFFAQAGEFGLFVYAFAVGDAHVELRGGADYAGLGVERTDRRR